MLKFVIEPRTDAIGQLVAACARGELAFSGPGSLCDKVSHMGYGINGLYEMVLAAERRE